MRRAGVRTLAIALAVAACGESTAPASNGGPPPGRPALDPTYRATGRAAAGDVFVHLFEWRWTDVAAECETVLGPVGYAAVQVSPPQEHALIAGHPWWQRYQPAGYAIARSRSGTEADFTDMVDRCAAAGVDIHVDAVINHMTAGAGTGSNGTVYTKYEYPGLWTRADFHTACGIFDYQSAANVQDCELLGLADLNTGAPSVRQTIAAYLIELARLGVVGFRIDAAKHIQPVELDSIMAIVNRTLAAEGRARPYIFAEVIDYGGEAVPAAAYYGLGYGSGGAADITEFRYRGIGDKFLRLGDQRVSDLDPEGPPGRRFTAAAWGMMPADKAVVFVENHDTQRSDGIGYRDGVAYRLANVFMLAHPYGHPKVMSSYAFDRGTQGGRDAGPPSDAGGATLPVMCAPMLEDARLGDWVCEHRDPVIAAMVGFRRAVAGAPLTDWWDDGAHAIAFSRGDRGFVAINNGDAAAAAAVPTGLPAGVFCDVLTGGLDGGECAGAFIVVEAGGTVQLQLPARSAVAVHVGTRQF